MAGRKVGFRIPLIQRFADKVLVGDGCWEWQGTRRNGYGVMRRGGTNNHRIAAHRFAWEFFRGPIPDGLVIDHLCRNTGCVNPAHLEPVKQRVNVLRGVSLAAENAKKTHCKRDHEFTAENTMHVRGERRCRACANARYRAIRAKKKEQAMTTSAGLLPIDKCARRAKRRKP